VANQIKLKIKQPIAKIRSQGDRFLFGLFFDAKYQNIPVKV
jgi:hypothetical protein